MNEILLRDGLMTCAILGFFASVWFGWAQEHPPVAWKVPLIVGSVLSVLVAITGGILAWQNWSSGSVLNDDRVFHEYLIIVGVEFGLAALGTIFLLLRGKSKYLAPWICFVVGVHFWPMAPVLQNAGLYVLSAVLTIVALAAVPIARHRDLTISAVTGAGAGISLLLFAAWSAIILSL